MNVTLTPSEHEVQCAFVQWFRLQWPGHRIIAIPNGGLRSKATAGKLRAEGVEAGVPDLFVPSCSLWIEMKTERGRLTGAQRDWIDYLNGVGHTAIVVHGLDAAMEQVKRVMEALL